MTVAAGIEMVVGWFLAGLVLAAVEGRGNTVRE
jgi:Kef-type K+ transport system membrane component KefB